jgi:hypothetical protein
MNILQELIEADNARYEGVAIPWTLVDSLGRAASRVTELNGHSVRAVVQSCGSGWQWVIYAGSAHTAAVVDTAAEALAAADAAAMGFHLALSGRA